MDIRLYTRCIVEKNGEYLLGLWGFPRWSNSPYDAWHTRTKADAIRVAWKLGGHLMLFNPIAGQLVPLASICDGAAEQMKAGKIIPLPVKQDFQEAHEPERVCQKQLTS